MAIQLDRYYNRFEDNPQYGDYKSLLFRAGDALQSAEMNEIQETFKRDVNFLAHRFLRNGEIIDGGNAEITLEATGTQNGSGGDLYDVTTTFKESIIFMEGNFVRVNETLLLYPDQYIPESDFTVGVQIILSELTNSDDATLLDPAVETRNYGQPGAGRLQIIGDYMLEEDYQDQEDRYFLPLYDIVRGEIYDRSNDEIVENGFNTFRQDVINIVAKYDRNANGNYLIHGYETEYTERVEIDDGQGGTTTSNLGPFRFSVADGSANVDGYNFEIDVSQEVDLEALIDFELKQDEPISFSSGDGWYPTRHTPLRKVFRVSGQRERIAEPMTHGSFIGATDELPNEYQPVRSVSEVRQGVTTYVAGVDYSLVGDSLTWLPGGNEPAPSSTYEVDFKYQYTETEGNFSEDPGNPGTFMGDMSADLKTIYFYGFADGTDVQYDYDFVLQRIDALFIDATGKLGYVKGVPDEEDPRVPEADPNMTLKIAEILLGGDYDPVVTLSSQRVFKMSDIQLILDSVKQNEYNLTRLALQANISESQPGATLRGQFVDDFENDDQRDAGITGVENNALTVGGNLMMDIDWGTENIDPDLVLGDEQMSLEMPSTTRAMSILSQPYWTKTRQINEYLFKSPPGAKIKITPAVYRWISKTSYKTFVKQVQVATRGINSFTTRFRSFGTHRWHQVIRSDVTTSVSREILGTSVGRSTSIEQSRTPAIIPQITVAIKSEFGDYNGNEAVNVTFDGKPAATINADINGTLNGNFVIPSNVLSGSKEVKATGAVSTVSGTTLFRAEPLSRTVQTTVTQWWRWVVRRQGVIWREADPVAQSFVLDDTIAVDKIDVVFNVLPTTDVSCVICETNAGFPDKNKAIISKTMAPADLAPAQTTTSFVFDNKMVLTKGIEYAFIIICKDAVGTVQVAELGEKTNNLPSIWLTGQAYSVGTLYNSSNNSAWTPLQKEDMRFWIYGCDFDNNYEVPYVEFDATVGDYPQGVTDVMVLANAKVYEGTAIQYKVELLDRPSGTLENMYLINSYSQMPIEEAYNGRIRVTAIFSSSGLYSPVLDPNIQLSLGYSHRESRYTSRGFPIERTDDKIVVAVDNYKPSGAVIGMQIQVIDPVDHVTETWEDMVIAPSSTPLGNDWVETEYTFDLGNGSVMDVDQDISRVKVIMTAPDDKNRPIISNLRLNTQKI